MRRSFPTSLAIGFVVTAATMAVLYAGARLLDLSYAPFALTDWIARVAPGDLLTSSIDGMVSVLRSLSVTDLSTGAKAIEQASGVVLLLILLTAAGAILYSRAPRHLSPAVLMGVVAGGLAGAALSWVVMAVGPSAGFTDAIWTIGALVGWGSVIGWSAATWSALSATGDFAPTAVGRRHFLWLLASASAALTVIGSTVGMMARGRQRGEGQPDVSDMWSSSHPLPNADAAVSPVPGTRSELTPVADHYRIDINTVSPRVDGAAWRLHLHGLVGRPLDLSLDEIRRREARHQFVTLSCISNPVAGSLIGTTRWTGVPLRTLLDEAQISPTASHLRIRSADGFDEVVATDLVRADERIMLTYAWDGMPLPVEHGYPLRIYIPDRYGMKQPKWIQDIEAISSWEPGYWVRRGWDREARVKATSVIDVIASDAKTAAGTIPIGGIAYAGARGISRVELRVDDGDWQPAALRTPLSPTTWVIWRYEWASQPGRHDITVRCVDGDGAMQIVEVSPPHPSGASGLDTRSIVL